MNIQTQRYSRFRGVVVGGVMGLLSMVCHGSNIAQITVKVTILSPPPCTINHNQPIEVDFGDVMTTRVDGKNYRMPINYTLDCTSLEKNTLRMLIMGNTVNLGQATNALETNIPNFGIGLERGTTAFNINTPLDFTFPNQPTLYAVPMKKDGVTLQTGGFTSSSVMQVTYQ
ncbi:fimbrial protein [Providencia vermicola]|uniref:fimbrial protein n=1 Tax=Providencia vermicola TaxID=333965 RepID=UPI003D2C503D